ncbi:MAG: GNAT family N-acetyltransferase [Candidatus Marinimicrobia bacterium]|nr:GNAT family N-acetyltransferase [Candidatus Neomarinimicrobiota bacterium]MBL7022869.1 GNAT family N-acetyltransferase [Candidatus Neomarinimicrobiota bacterium]MBL7109188.1 GNAT family N-acetyltransferase [Candidatus Neomarinimicrobiota bacterium]
MDKQTKLRDGTSVLIRPLTKEDVDNSFSFFQTLSQNDRNYLRADVTQKRIIERRIKAMENGNIYRFIAIINGEIVADGSLELEENGWKEHVGELRLIVSPAYQRMGLGMLMAHELYIKAVYEKVDEIIVKIMKPQNSALRIFQRMGFKEHATFPDYVKDVDGNKHDLIVMRCDLQILWDELENYFEDSDWQRAR